MSSGKNIVIPVKTPPAADTLPRDAPDAEVYAIFQDLRHLMHSTKANDNDKLDILISALIDRGINSGPRIVGAAVRLDFDGAHAGIRLSHGIGRRWMRDADRTYHNLL
ncbi:MAG: hypothetical protein EON59_00945 [Alphaproteobacteria bacterium]|nr:MAG: hypothetical protein EON59_00945 [Alphaproteobacteria bacterium]